MDQNIETFMQYVEKRHANQPLYHQAVREVIESVFPLVAANRDYQEHNILERVVEPERAIQFRVTWRDDSGAVQVNRGYRVQMNSAIGPYKGGLRFHPSVRLGLLKFLAFEQIFKNSLTTLPMGGGKGGADFNPAGKSDWEVMRFCQAFMDELYRHIGADIDVPAGDIGVGGREIGYLFGRYRRIRNEFTGVLTGKGLDWGGSLIRPEATGYGATYFAAEMLGHVGDDLRGKTACVSGSGNVAQYTVEKVTQLGGKAITMSDSSGTIVDKDGFDQEKLAFVMELKNVRRERIYKYLDQYPNAVFLEGARPWGVPCDAAFPSATQNEISASDAQTLVDNGVKVVSEGANMPTAPDAIHIFQNGGVLYGPGKAANAGGVATSGLEMSQNSMRMRWDREEVDQRLQGIMRNIHENCVAHGTTGGSVDYVKGANIAGFIKVADAMVAQGIG